MAERPEPLPSSESLRQRGLQLDTEYCSRYPSYSGLSTNEFTVPAHPVGAPGNAALRRKLSARRPHFQQPLLSAGVRVPCSLSVKVWQSALSWICPAVAVAVAV